jgi:hypothetical protein
MKISGDLIQKILDGDHCALYEANKLDIYVSNEGSLVLTFLYNDTEISSLCINTRLGETAHITGLRTFVDVRVKV